MPCKLCGKNRKLIRAHIIPRSFYEIDPHSPPVIATNTKGIHPRRSQIGIYDKHLVCEPCERIFGPYDDYAADLLLSRRATQEPIVQGGRTTAFVYKDVDYHHLKLFFLAVLWRASQSTDVVFSRVDLGSHEPPVRQALLSRNPGDDETYGVVLAKFPGPTGMLDPHPTLFSGVNFMQIHLAEYVAYVKVDKSPTPEPHRRFLLTPGKDLTIPVLDPSNNQSINVMRDIVRRNPGIN